MGQLANSPPSAVATSPAASSHEARQYLTFQLGGEMYAVGILNVKEIIEFGQVTEIPMMPKVIRGVINLRGAVVPVIDLGARFGGTPTAVGRRTCIVIIELRHDDQRHDVGVVVDAVSEVVDIPAADIEPAPTFGARIRADFIDGMGKIAGRFVIILNADRVLSVDEIASVAGIASTGADSLPA